MAPPPAAAGHQQSSPPAAAGADGATDANRSSSASANVRTSTGGGGDRERTISSSRSSGKRRRSDDGGGDTTRSRAAASDLNKGILQRLHQSCDKHKSEMHDLEGGSTDEALRSYGHYRRPMEFASSVTVEEIERLMDEPRAEGPKSRGRCRKHLTSFRSVLERVEGAYTDNSGKIAEKIDRLDANTADERSTDGGGSAASAHAVDGRIGAGVDDKEMLETAGYASNLCSIYRLIIEGSFCPYSVYMIDWGRGGVHVMPRVLLLMQSLSSTPIIVQTLRKVSEAADSVARSGKTKPNNTGGTESATPQSCDDELDSSMVLNDIARAVALLLNRIPELQLRTAIIRDLVSLVYDSSVVVGSACPLPLIRAESNQHEASGIRLSLFHEMIEAREKMKYIINDSDDRVRNKSYELDIKSKVSLLSLQCGVMRVLSTLLHAQHQDRKYALGMEAVEDLPMRIGSKNAEFALQSNGNRYLESAGVDDRDLKMAIFASLRQILLSPSSSTPANTEAYVLDLLTKVEAVNFMALLWDDFLSSNQGSSGTMGMDVIMLCCQALLSHLRTTALSSSDVESLSSSIHFVSSRYVSAFHSVFVAFVASLEPLLSSEGGGDSGRLSKSLLVKETSSTHSSILCTLLQCVKFIPELMQSFNHMPSDDAKKLCKLVLRIVHVLLNTTPESSKYHAFAHNHCVVHEIYPNLLGLVKDPILSPIAIVITRDLLGDTNDVDRNMIFVDACTISWQQSEERRRIEDEQVADHDKDQTNATGDKRRKVSLSKYPRTVGHRGGGGGGGGPGFPKEQLQIERSSKGKRTHSDMTSPISRSSLLSSVEYVASDASPTSSMARILDEALNEANFLIRDAALATKVQGQDGTIDGNVESAVLSAMTARSISVIGGAFNVVIGLGTSKDMAWCSAAGQTIATLARAIELLARAVRYGSMAPVEARTIGPNRLKRALNVLVGVGLQLHSFLSSNAEGDRFDADLLSALKVAWDCVCTCSVEVWTLNSSLLEQQRDRERNGGHSTLAGFYVDQLDASLEDQLVVERNIISNKKAHSPWSHTTRENRLCAGTCTAVCAAVGITASESLSSRCFCSLLLRKRRDDIQNGSFAEDLACIILESELPLASRCMLLGSVGLPCASTSFRTILVDSPLKDQSSIVVTSALAFLPSCISLITQRNDARMEKKNFIQSINKLGLHRGINALAFPSQGSSSVPSALCRAAVVCLHQLLDIYISCSDTENRLDEPAYNKSASALLLGVASRFSASEDYRSVHNTGGGRQSASTLISSAAFDLLVSPMILAKENFTNMPSQVRLVKWKYLAFASHHCSALQLRKSGGHVQLLASGSIASGNDNKQPSEEFECDDDEEDTGAARYIPSLLRLLQVPFVDPDSVLRDYAADNIGPVLLRNDCKVLYTLFLNDSEWPEWVQDSKGSMEKYSRDIVERFFREIDSLLYRYCYVNQSQLSFTAGGPVRSTAIANSSSASASRSRSTGEGNAALALSHQISALKALSSICLNANRKTPHGISLFEHSLLHIIRLWVSPNSSRMAMPHKVDVCVPGASILSSTAWNELCRIDSECGLWQILLSDDSMYRFMPTIYSQILAPMDDNGKPCAVEPSEMEWYLQCMIRFTRAFLVEGLNNISESRAFVHTRHSYMPRREQAYGDISEFNRLYFPAIASALIVDRDIEALKMCYFFRAYILDEGKHLRGEGEQKSLGEKVRGENAAQQQESTFKELIRNTDLSEKLTELYANPLFVGKVLPRLLLEPGSESMYFYVRTILRSKIGLTDIFADTYLTQTLKDIIWEMGKYDITDVCDKSREGYHSVLALQKLGLIHDLKVQSEKDKGNRDVMKNLGAVYADASTSEGYDAARRLVSKRMMMLVINTAMTNWAEQSLSDRLRALRCLKTLFLFLHEEDSPKYLTQIMSTINKAMSTSSPRLHVGALSVLSDYVQMVLKQNVKLIGANLSDIVVALCPVFEESTYSKRNRHAQASDANEEKSDPYQARSVDEALKLLACLVTGKVGKKLKKYFSEIPFLPSSPALDGVRSDLKRLGVDIDDLAVMTQSTTQATQGHFTGRESIGSVGNESEKSRPKLSSNAQAALRKRLGILSKLLSHENKQVRIAVLRHLTDLLRANRGLFLRLVESEESVSMRFLTVVSKDVEVIPVSEEGAEGANDLSSVIGKGGVTEIVQKLVSRCVIEMAADARIALAKCLGEMGAIDPNRLGREVHATSAALLTKDSFDVSGFHGSWRLSQPPWKSQVIRYELHLVTHQLVMSLKAAKETIAQHKIAFAIQELLLLLDESAKKLYASSQSQPAIVDSSSGEANEPTKEMGAWLRGKLEDAGVHDVLEPYWRTLYKQKDIGSPSPPPFFVKADTYFVWLRGWCRYMIWRSNESQRSRWKALFHACRSAIRQDASICEFLLPLLILDGLCFGEDFEEYILKEMLDCLTFGNSSMTSRMPLTERQKAVNAVFVVLDTLSLWAERETEDRHRSIRGSAASSSSSMSYLAGSDTEWPAEESLAKIEDLLKAIPFSICAKAAEAVGMHARSLRYLEMDARSHIAKSVYDGVQTESYLYHNGEGDINAMNKTTLLGNTIGIDTQLMRTVLGRLGDNDTMASISQVSAQFSRDPIDNIRERELRGDWEGSLQMYEQALQLQQVKKNRDEGAADADVDALSLKTGMVKCLLELGQLESALNQTKGIIAQGSKSAEEQPAPTIGKKRDRISTYKSLDENASKVLMPSAAEAAWRLGQWDTLDDIIGTWNTSSSSNADRNAPDPDSQYGIFFGRAMLGLHQGMNDSVAKSLEVARTAVVQSLSGAARESYSRAYPYLLRLQCIREVEDAAELMRATSDSTHVADLSMSFADLARSEAAQGWEWDGRLRIADSSALGSSAIMNARLALTRIFDDPVLEGALWLKEGKRARKSGLFHIAENSLAHADAAFVGLEETRAGLHPSLMIALHRNTNDVQMQFAKLKAATGESTAALRLLAQEQIDVRELLSKDDASLQKAANAIQERRTRTSLSGDVHQDIAVKTRFEENVKIFGRNLLTGTEWICESGLKSASEIIDRYDLVSSRLLPHWERGHFCFAKYLDSLLESRIKALAGQAGKGKDKDSTTIPSGSKDDDETWANIVREDVGCQKYLLQALEEYGQALQLGTKHVFQALPRLLSLWFEFNSIEPRSQRPGDEGGRRSSSSPASIAQERVAMQLEKMQKAANEVIGRNVSAIPAISFYTALPQLISRVGHRDRMTADVVVIILKRLLTKFPQQVMWSLGWLRNSANSARQRAGNEIFKGAQKNFREREDMDGQELLEASKSLFTYLISVAKHQPKDQNKRYFKANPFKYRGVELSRFVPPVQAALSVIPSTIGYGNGTSSRENFPAFVPRMRSFSTTVGVMASKARPKKMTAFAIPAGQSPQLRRSASSTSSGRSQPGDVGEMHFLVKQEAKGDLRKDARVQDLNNVINRLLSGHGVNSGSCGKRQRRRLHLRTFSVICLSEDCGILEWVPNTDSLRNLIMSSYNPQAAPDSMRRRGQRLGNFMEPNIRNSYEKCQEMYFKSGHLTRAAMMLEELILKPFPPLLYWWFVQKFLDPHAWFEARMAFTLSAATWSAVGHVIGLGDRHSENILVDTSSGDCVHVDFDCIFDKALLLPRPEVVPFRLSPNMLDAFGPTGAEGAFTGGMISAMGTLRDNQDILLSVLEPFLKDPIIDWKKHRSQQKQGGTGAAGTSTSEVAKAKRHIKTIQGRLNGVYNLVNPNAGKFPRHDAHEQDDDMTHLLPLSVEGQVHKMITEATNNENLVQTYIGWMPWL